MIDGLKRWGSAWWKTLRQLSGDDAYERYLKHHADHHSELTPLTREVFFRQWQERKWNGVKRCC
ncbi:YbdD/YjiX family protein [Novimethylophilus kurashikiensis]|uniref:YbdD/YjiX family protein n=1 Tax=Novimethylophilus kurashikiensis TaxID=1825523 RepID=UPI000D5A15CA|nr:YbdD/YjiX family protein [Novimethylophilus kurashikiensis]